MTTRNVYQQIVIFLYAACVVCSARAAEPAECLKLGVDAKIIAQGGAYTQSLDGASAAYWNPAYLGLATKRELNIMYAQWIGNTDYQYALCAFPSKIGGFCVGVQRVSVGDILETDASGGERGTYTPQDTVTMASWGGNLKLAYIGVTAKYISSKIKNEAQTYTYDVGMMKPLFNKKMFVAFHARNLGGALRYHQEEDTLQQTYGVGCGYTLMQRLSASVVGEYQVQNNKTLWSTGMRYVFREMYSISAGYTTRYSDFGASGFSYGAGISLRYIDLQYAYVPLNFFHEQGHYVNIAVYF